MAVPAFHTSQKTKWKSGGHRHRRTGLKVKIPGLSIPSGYGTISILFVLVLCDLFDVFTGGGVVLLVLQSRLIVLIGPFIMDDVKLVDNAQHCVGFGVI